jgi:GNAT superfamily N-acetyltransferase
MDNLKRMIQLADEVFAAKNDPSQLSVDDGTMERLRALHSGTLSQEEDENGPFAWVLVVPTTQLLMEQFLSKEIGEKELLDRTPLNVRYDALYLCSALVLPEYRGRGAAQQLLIDAVSAVRKDHPIKDLFVWSFTPEGRRLAHRIAKNLSMPLRERRP